MTQQLGALCRIFEFSRENEEEYSVESFLKTVPSEETEEVCKMLNKMVEVEDAFFRKGNIPYEYKIDLSNNNIIDSELLFGLRKYPYRTQMEILNGISDEMTKLSEQQKSIEKQVDALKDLEKGIQHIAVVKEEIEAKKKEVESVKEAISKRSQIFEKEAREANERAKKDAASEASRTVREKIEEALTRSGSIGSFLQDIQKDFIQYMAIFIAIFSLVNLNIGGGEGRTLTDFLGINLLLISAMVTLFALLFLVLHRQKEGNQKEKASLLLWIVAIALWAITAIVFVIIK